MKVRNGQTYVMGAAWYASAADPNTFSPGRHDYVVLGPGDAKQLDALLRHVPELHREGVKAFLRPFVDGRWPWNPGEERPQLGTYSTNVIVWWKLVDEDVR